MWFILFYGKTLLQIIFIFKITVPIITNVREITRWAVKLSFKKIIEKTLPKMGINNL